MPRARRRHAVRMDRGCTLANLRHGDRWIRHTHHLSVTSPSHAPAISRALPAAVASPMASPWARVRGSHAPMTWSLCRPGDSLIALGTVPG